MVCLTTTLCEKLSLGRGIKKKERCSILLIIIVVRYSEKQEMVKIDMEVCQSLPKNILSCNTPASKIKTVRKFMRGMLCEASLGNLSFAHGITITTAIRIWQVWLNIVMTVSYWTVLERKTCAIKIDMECAIGFLFKTLMMVMFDNMEVIGNIYENTELIKNA